MSRPASPAAMASFPNLFRAPGAPQDQHSCAAQNKRKFHKSGAGQQTLWSNEMDPAVLAFAESTQESLAQTIIPESQRAFIRRNSSVRRLYDDWLLPDLLARVQTGSLTKATIDKDRQAIRRWESYSPRPETWPEADYWPGVPIEFISPKYVELFLVNLFNAVPTGTAKSTWSHIRSIFNLAVKVRAMETVPHPEHVPTGANDPVRVYRAEEIEAAYYSLKAHVELQVSFVLAINAGPRSHDLYLMRWDGVDLTSHQPYCSFVSRKTGKLQKVPLAPVTVAQLRRLPSLGNSEYLFPNLSSARAADPEKSTAARRRRDIMRDRLLIAGIDLEKPIQVARASCNTRLENHRTGAGSFVLGHSLTLNAKHYHEPSDMVFDAVTTVPQPACFSDF